MKNSKLIIMLVASLGLTFAPAAQAWSFSNWFGAKENQKTVLFALGAACFAAWHIYKMPAAKVESKEVVVKPAIVVPPVKAGVSDINEHEKALVRITGKEVLPVGPSALELEQEKSKKLEAENKRLEELNRSLYERDAFLSSQFEERSQQLDNYLATSKKRYEKRIECLEQELTEAHAKIESMQKEMDGALNLITRYR